MSTNITELKRKLEEALGQKSEVEQNIKNLEQQIEEAKKTQIFAPELEFYKNNTHPIFIISKRPKFEGLRYRINLTKEGITDLVRTYIDEINDQDPDFEVKDWQRENWVYGLVIQENLLFTYHYMFNNSFIASSYVYEKNKQHLEPLLKFLTETKAIMRGEEKPLFHLLF